MVPRTTTFVVKGDATNWIVHGATPRRSRRAINEERPSIDSPLPPEVNFATAGRIHDFVYNRRCVTQGELIVRDVRQPMAKSFTAGAAKIRPTTRVRIGRAESRPHERCDYE
jgi:hypothetical protein